MQGIVVSLSNAFYSINVSIFNGIIIYTNWFQLCAADIDICHMILPHSGEQGSTTSAHNTDLFTEHYMLTSTDTAIYIH